LSGEENHSRFSKSPFINKNMKFPSLLSQQQNKYLMSGETSPKTKQAESSHRQISRIASEGEMVH
jgi:hypothetical protein